MKVRMQQQFTQQQFSQFFGQTASVFVCCKSGEVEKT
jgi:hypothetical protein